jgi:hypothetical protein
VEAVAAQDIQVGVLEWGEPGDVLVQDVVLALVGGPGPQLLDDGVQVAGGPQRIRGKRVNGWCSCRWNACGRVRKRL